ncbi:hypothetical protein ACVIGB_000466 [Bradyrhizobium sp. USDA 4341]
MANSNSTEILVNGTTSTAEQYRHDYGLTKDQYRDMVFDLGMYGKYEAPNGDMITDPARALQPGLRS